MFQELKNWHHETMANKAVTALIDNHFKAIYCKTRLEAIEHIRSLIPENAGIGVGGSWTIGQLDILDKLAAEGHPIFNHNQPGLTNDQKAQFRLQQLTCDVFLTGSNAVTLDGKIVNVDGAGNRVAAMIFGPKKVIVVVGINKLVKDLAAAENRIKACAGPLNNKRLNTVNPCVKTGECMDCQGPARICNVTTIISKKPLLTDITVVIIGEELGF